MTPNPNGLIGDHHTRVVIPMVPGCCGDCQQGRRPCPCPDVGADDASPTDRRERAVFWALYLAALIVAIAWGVSWLLPLVAR